MTPREFAYEITLKLQKAGHQALWAGGCVRDQLLGKSPKDYDVATSATPEQVQDLFGHKRTLAIGASFGVITVLGPKIAGQIEVATFRRDAGYSDGRRPDAVEFTDAREDAIRRDFTINGMFFDPVTEKVHDYVGGVSDLEKKIIRAIGDPNARIDEDKLRMLRAVRFAATYGFEIERKTLAAIQQHAGEIIIVSGERIGAEIRRMLAHPNRAVAAGLLRESNLLEQVLEDSETLFALEDSWQEMLRGMKQLPRNEFISAASVFLAKWLESHSVDEVARQWKFSNDEKKSIEWIHAHDNQIANADKMLWSEIQPLLIHSDAERAVDVCETKLRAREPAGDLAGVKFCRVRLGWPQEQLDPAPLLDGNKLKQLNLDGGPVYGQILRTVRAEQLDGKIKTAEQAAALAREIAGD